MESGINNLNVSRKALAMSQAKSADALSSSSDATTSWSSRFAPGINSSAVAHGLCGGGTSNPSLASPITFSPVVEVAVGAVSEDQATITLLSSLTEAQAGTGLRGIDQPAPVNCPNPYLIGTSCLPDQVNLRKTDSNRLKKEPCLSPFSVMGVDNQTSTDDLRSTKADSYYNSFTNPSSSSNCNPPPGRCGTKADYLLQRKADRERWLEGKTRGDNTSKSGASLKLPSEMAYNRTEKKAQDTCALWWLEKRWEL
ncbi:hypothetical protein PPACK8108_LOCUS18000 [Phakopsora pachyrhizi]|uniref:Uncharacterized protein n=1 Tax=Phakopsora pachyrhizi TaxID=170000 RepID=A0AAV0BDB2_PHAPC|nr:hypothetical protein PPACK8108_LOCUS18000 [Phakopsora pachyrhizi]